MNFNSYLKIIIIKIVILTSLLGCSTSFAKNLGTIGQVYPIQEPDFLEFIQTQAIDAETNGKLNQLQSALQRRATTYRDRPTRVTFLQHVIQTRSWIFDPSIVLDHDIKTPDGKLIAQQGTRIDPLDHVPLTKTLIFYDADDQEEVKWVIALDKKLKGRDKLILVNGSLLTEEKRFSKSVYFDQEGRLTKRFGIEHVPATIVQEGHVLRIMEWMR